MRLGAAAGKLTIEQLGLRRPSGCAESRGGSRRCHAGCARRARQARGYRGASEATCETHGQEGTATSHQPPLTTAEYGPRTLSRGCGEEGSCFRVKSREPKTARSSGL